MEKLKVNELKEIAKKYNEYEDKKHGRKKMDLINFLNDMEKKYGEIKIEERFTKPELIKLLSENYPDFKNSYKKKSKNELLKMMDEMKQSQSPIRIEDYLESDDDLIKKAVIECFSDKNDVDESIFRRTQMIQYSTNKTIFDQK